MNRTIRLTSLGFAVGCLVLSGPVQGGESPPPMAEAWKKSFTAFLVGQYGFNGTADCYAGPDRQPFEWTWNRLRGLALGRNTDTGWTPGS